MFSARPTAYLVMGPDLVIVEADPAYLQLIGRTRDELIGRYVFDAFPPAADGLDPDGTNPLQTSFEVARDSGEPDVMPLSVPGVVVSSGRSTGHSRTRRGTACASGAPRGPGT